MKFFFSIVFLIMILTVFSNAQSAYRNEIAKWRANYETELKSENGWLSLAGLFWLKEGVNTIGKGEIFDIQLTENFKGKKFGQIFFQHGVATLKIEKGAEALHNNKQISEMILVSDENQKQTIIQTGSQTFYLIKREDRYGIRLKDKNHPNRLKFTGLKWFPIAEKYRVVATFEPFTEPKEVLIPNTMGGSYRAKSEGILKFKLQGKNYSLQPVESEGKLFIIFRDLTSKTASYSVGRFLYAEKAKNNQVVLDFNRAENPPCAYTSFATCPIPPPQNRLPIAIKAGEKRYEPSVLKKF